MGDAAKSTLKLVTVPFLTLKFHSPVKMTLNASVILKSDSGTVITKEAISPIAEKLSFTSISSDAGTLLVVFP